MRFISFLGVAFKTWCFLSSLHAEVYSFCLCVFCYNKFECRWVIGCNVWTAWMRLATLLGVPPPQKEWTASLFIALIPSMYSWHGGTAGSDACPFYHTPICCSSLCAYWSSIRVRQVAPTAQERTTHVGTRASISEFGVKLKRVVRYIVTRGWVLVCYGCCTHTHTHTQVCCNHCVCACVRYYRWDGWSNSPFDAVLREQRPGLTTGNGRGTTHSGPRCGTS